jgi:hypothetical protein
MKTIAVVLVLALAKEAQEGVARGLEGPLKRLFGRAGLFVSARIAGVTVRQELEEGRRARCAGLGGFLAAAPVGTRQMGFAHA